MAAGVLDVESDALHEATAAMRARLDAIGACWGDDAVGERFAVRYRAAAQTVLANLDALSSGLGHIAAALRAVADNYQRADLAAAAIETTAVDPAVTSTTAPGGTALGAVAAGTTAMVVTS